MRAPRVKTLSTAQAKRFADRLAECPNFGPRGNVTGMRRLYYGNEALLVRVGVYVYNVSRDPDIYNAAR